MRRQQRHWRGGRCTGATVSTLPGVWVTGFRGEWLPGSGWHEGTRPLERSSCLSRPPTVNPHTYSICTAATPRPQCLLHKPVRWAPRLAPTPGTKSCVPSQGGLCSQRRVPEGFHNAGQATGSRAQLSVNPDLPMGHAGPESQSRPRGTSTCISELPVLIQLHHQSFCTP